MNFFDIPLQEEYQFLRNEKRLGRNLILLAVAGSYAYGTNVEESDIDLRGVTLDQKSDIIGLSSFQQYTDPNTDTVIFGFNRYVQLLMECNPAALELLGLHPEHYVFQNDAGTYLVQNRKIFLSKKAFFAYSGYASSQRKKFESALALDAPSQSARETYMFETLRKYITDFNSHCRSFSNSHLNLFLGKAINPELETELFINANLQNVPLRDFKELWQSISNILKEYGSAERRSTPKDNPHLNKAALHAARAYMTGIDILEKGDIITYRAEEHDLLMKIRSGGFQRSDNTFDSSFTDLLTSLRKRMKYAYDNTSLPDKPNQDQIQDFIMSVNEQVIRGSD